MTGILIYCFIGLKMWLAPVKDFLMIQHVQTPGLFCSVFGYVGCASLVTLEMASGPVYIWSFILD